MIYASTDQLTELNWLAKKLSVKLDFKRVLRIEANKVISYLRRELLGQDIAHAVMDLENAAVLLDTQNPLLARRVRKAAALLEAKR